MFVGALTALITPFRDDRIDEKALRAIVSEQIEQGIDGLVPAVPHKSLCRTHAPYTPAAPAQSLGF